MKSKSPVHSVRAGWRAARANRQAARVSEESAEAARDAALIKRFNAGDTDVFNQIVARHHSRILALANRILHNEADAEEIAQDTFIRAHRNLAHFRGDCSLAAWLYRIAVNLARNRLRFNARHRRQGTISFDRPEVAGGTAPSAAYSDAAADPRAESMTTEFVALVADSMGQLEASDREILTLRTMRNLSYEEIANRLQVRVGTVRRRLRRAREKLRLLLHQRAP